MDKSTEKTAPKKWTVEDERILRSEYKRGEPASVKALAAKMGRSERSIQSKLVSMQIYVVAEKPKAAPKAPEGPSKAEILAAIKAKSGFDAEGFEGVNKENLARLRDFLPVVSA